MKGDAEEQLVVTTQGVVDFGGEFAVGSKCCVHFYLLAGSKWKFSRERLPFVPCRIHGIVGAIQDKYTFLRYGRDHTKWSNFKARIKPEAGIAVIRRNQQVFENRRPWDPFCVTVARDSGTRA